MAIPSQLSFLHRCEKVFMGAYVMLGGLAGLFISDVVQVGVYPSLNRDETYDGVWVCFHLQNRNPI